MIGMRRRLLIKSSTFRVNKLSIWIPVFAFLFVLVIGGLAEVLIRWVVVNTNYHETPSKGFDRYILELKLNRLDNLVEDLGHVDVIFLGSSMVHRGLDPKLFQREIYTATNHTITAFNLGIPGIKSKDAASIAKVLVQKYKPKLIIYGISVRDFDGQYEASGISDNPWVRYELGNFNLDGWLREKSLAYQYYLVYRNWMKVDFDEQIKQRRYYDRVITAKGFLNSDNVLQEDPEAWKESAIKSYENYFLDPSYVNAVEIILQLQKLGTKIVIVEMPVQTEFIQYYPHQTKDQEQFIQAIQTVVSSFDSPFLPTTGLVTLPENGWYSKNHLNSIGADVFTRWLAHELVTSTTIVQALIAGK